jgi:hypothetical protein
MPPPEVVPINIGRPEPSFEELERRADDLAAGCSTEALTSTRTVLMSLYLSAGEALDRLEADEARGEAYERSLGAVGGYFIHACRLSRLTAGHLIAERFDQEESDLPPALKAARR